MGFGLQVEGLATLRKSLKYLEQGDDLVELRDGLKAAAGIVATEAAHRAGSFSSRAAATIRPTVSGNRAFVVGGRAKLSWYGWADFGTRTPVRGNSRSQGPWKRSGKGPKKGRFIFPAFDAKEREVVKAVGDAMDVAHQKAGF